MGSIGEKYIDGRTVSEMDYAQWDGFSAPPVSPLFAGRIYFDSAQLKLLASENAGAYVTFVGTGGSDTPWKVDHDANGYGITNLSNVEVNGKVTADTIIAGGIDIKAFAVAMATVL